MLNQNSKLIASNLPKAPFWALAPMANITTYPFASQCVAFGADLVWTPMVHTDTVINNWDETRRIIDFKKIDNFIIQLVGSEPEKFATAIKIIESKGLRPIGFDINTGCPDKNIVKSGCGGALLESPDNIIEIVTACKAATKLPISVKTRAGYDDLTDIFSLAPRLVRAGISMLTVHPRTVKQGYTGKADWDVIKNLKQQMSSDSRPVTIIGSGDVISWEKALVRQKETNCDGVMIGRGALGHPWIFQEIKEGRDIEVMPEKIKDLALNLAQKADAIWGSHGIVEARKHFAWFFRGFDGAKELRTRLMVAETLAEVKQILLAANS